MDNSNQNHYSSGLADGITAHYKSEDFIKSMKSALKRFKLIKKEIPKELFKKIEKLKKAKRRESNKSRKINQAKNRLNKFQRKK